IWIFWDSNLGRGSSSAATSPRCASTGRRSGIPSRIRRSVSRPGCSTTTPTATRRSRTRFSTGRRLATSPATTPSTPSRALADEQRDVGRTGVLGGDTRWSSGVQAPAASPDAPRRLHRLPRRDLLGAAALGEEGLPQPHLFNEVDRGGHFAAWEEPELFAAE